MNAIPALKVTNLIKDFGGLRAVDNMSFEVGADQLVGFIGPNGCGKTTTFNCISGLMSVTSGSIEIFGQEATSLRPDQIHALGLTRTFQHTRLWREMTVIENLLVAPRDQFAPSVIKALLRPASRESEVERIDRAYSILESLEMTRMAGNLASELSGGQSKLIDIARALMSTPRFLLLDEPVAGVAGPLAEKIFENLRELTEKNGIGMLVIEHNMDFILRRGVDRIIVANSGKILMQGTPDEVRNNSEVINAYLGSQ